MLKRTFQITGLVCAFSLCAFAQAKQQNLPQVQVNKVTIDSLKIGTACGSGAEVDCIDVQWTTKSIFGAAQLLFELSGSIGYESGSSSNNGTPVSNGAATTAKVSFFHSGSGSIKTATIKLKLFQRGLNGAKTLLAETTKTQAF